MTDPGNHSDTPNIPSSAAVLRIQSSILIDAPLQDVWNALTDTSTYPKWNRFVPRVTVREQPESNNADADPVLREGTKFTFHVHMYPETKDTPQPELAGLRDTFLQVTEFKPPTEGDNTSNTINSTSTSTDTRGRKGRIVWASDPTVGGIVSWLLVAERVHEVSEVLDENGRTMTQVRNWESQVGCLAYVVKWLFGGQLRGNFGVWEEGMKVFAESRSGGG